MSQSIFLFFLQTCWFFCNQIWFDITSPWLEVSCEKRDWFLSFVFGVDACFVFDFIVFYLWVNSDITCWRSRHTAWFQIPYLGSCPPLIDWKISQVSSAKCLASLIWEPIFFQIYTGSLEFGFKLIVLFFSEKYANFIHRQGTTDYKVHG